MKLSYTKRDISFVFYYIYSSRKVGYQNLNIECFDDYSTGFVHIVAESSLSSVISITTFATVARSL